MEDFLRRMPKCEMHLHIEGTLEPGLRDRLAERNGVSLPPRPAYDFHDLTSFLVGYYEGMSVLVTEPDPPAKFAAVFARARAEGYLLTMHCDVDQPGSIEHIRQALMEIGVDRIDHGVNILEDPALVEKVKRRGLGLTVCPVSNRFVTDGTKAAELQRNAIEASWAPPAVRQEFLDRLAAL